MAYYRGESGGSATVAGPPGDFELIAEVFGPTDWVHGLEQFNVRYVVQLGELLATSHGRQALTNLDHPIPNLEEVEERVDGALREREGVSLIGPPAANPQTGLRLRTLEAHGLGAALPEPLQDVAFGDPVPDAEGIRAAAGNAPPTGWGQTYPGLRGSVAVQAPAVSGQQPPEHDLLSILTPVRHQFYR